MKRVCVFCGSSGAAKAVHVEAARALGRALVDRGLGLVYGGASVGLMGILADTVLAGGGNVYGVIPRPMVERELAHRGLTELHVVATMHERKQRMHDFADAFVALPGGFGTLDELFEALTWAQLGMHSKPCALLNVDGYYDALLVLLDRALDDGLLRREHRFLVLVETEANALVDRLHTWQPPALPKWISRGQE